MIVFESVTKTVPDHAKTRTVLSTTNITIPTDRRIALLGPSKEDNKILLNLLGALVLPTAGRIVRRVRVSFPVGYFGGFAPDLPVRVNVAHLARLYDADVQQVLEFVERSARIGSAFDRPFGLLPNPTKKLLARIIAYTLPFDVYLLSDDVLRGAAKGKDLSYDLFTERARSAGMIILTNNVRIIREHCDMGMVLDGGVLTIYDRISHAVAASVPEKKAAVQERRASRQERKGSPQERQAALQERKALARERKMALRERNVAARERKAR